jgi:hypothetical protein
MHLTTTPSQMSFDGSSTQGGAGAGIVFLSPNAIHTAEFPMHEQVSIPPCLSDKKRLRQWACDPSTLS